MKCTLYSKEEIYPNSPIVVYLHGISSSRLEGYSVLPVLSPEISLLVYDYVGSGQSDGEYVSLGYNESLDLEYIIQYIIDNLHTN